MKEKWRIGWRRWQEAMWRNPVEVLLALFFCLLGSYSYESGADKWTPVLFYAPVLFLTTHMLNRLMQGAWRLLYGLSALLFLPIYGMDFHADSWSYQVTLLVVQLLYGVSYGKRSNDDFVSWALHYLTAGASSLLLAGVLFMSLHLIYYSADALFEIGWGHYGRFSTYAASFAFLCVMPLLYLFFYQTDKAQFKGGRLFDVMVNFILSPALMVYTLILYLYIIKIIAQASLPKGTVAMMVIGYGLASFLLKGCQLFVSKHYYDAYFRYSSVWLLPSLLLFWVGTCYRIHQYGFTEHRVYLVVVGLILTLSALLFLFRQTARYFYVACLTLVGLSAVTYIPGIRAKDIERLSQEGRTVGSGKNIVTTDYTLQRETSVCINGYRKAWPVYAFQKEGAYYLSDNDRQLRLYDAAGNLCLHLPLDSLWLHQLRKADLMQSDKIPASVDSLLLQVEIESGLLLFENITYSQDSVSRLRWVSPWIFLER